MDQSSPLLPKLQQLAINSALSNNWAQALELNLQILEQEPNNVDTLNRTARAYFELGKLPQAKKYYQQALTADPYNQIAYKFLKKIEMCNKKGVLRPGNAPEQPECPERYSLLDLFIEEPGKTKQVSLLKLAEPQKLSFLCSGEIVKLLPKTRYITVTNQHGEYLGSLPDDISRRLIKFIHGGNKYQALIKNIKNNSLTILIRETYRSSRFKNQPSFQDNNTDSFIYSSEHIVVPEESEDTSNSSESFEEEAA